MKVVWNTKEKRAANFEEITGLIERDILYVNYYTDRHVRENPLSAGIVFLDWDDRDLENEGFTVGTPWMSE